jgi:hypothetical protein
MLLAEFLEPAFRIAARANSSAITQFLELQNLNTLSLRIAATRLRIGDDQ